MKILVLSFLLLALISCGKEASQNVKIDLNQFVTNSAEYRGGIYLYGVSEKGDSFTRLISPDTGVFESEIPNDVWTFYVMAWKGSAGLNTGFSEDARCATSGRVDLNSNDQEVTVFLKNSVCYEYDNTYTDPHFYLGTFDLKVSDSGPCNLQSGNNCMTYSVGVITHGKIVVQEMNYFNNNLQFLDKKRSSICFELVSALNPAFVNFPFKNIPGHFGIGTLELHGEATCQDTTANQVQKLKIGGPRIYKESSVVKVLVD